ncbi:unnamed protein product [Moneuplotes crassus]|uniref:Uncharacterized protein n=1 Tax=Euplotes crassus TaxID=5936 RepID=A0AAD1U7K4_EUPCR|nr:unnamed protein product [Moneuplotes crassus]
MFSSTTFTYTFNAFETYDLQIDWNDQTQGAALKLSWDCGSGSTVIPSKNYETTNDIGGSPLQISVGCIDKYEQTPSTTDQCRPICGDGFVIGTEACDDNNIVNGDGCKSDCTAVESSWVCSGGSSTSKSVCEECTQGFYQNDPSNPTYCVTRCGDGYRVGTEICDDANTVDEDGCKSDCSVESGYVCTGGNSTNQDSCVLCSTGFYPNDSVQPTECITQCNDGYRVGSEACDDGNTIDGDGCSSDCNKIELAWKCDTSFPNVCIRDYKSVPMSSSEKSTQAGTLCIIAIVVYLNLIGGSLSSSSTNSILSSVNQLQLLILFLLCDIFIPLRVVTYLRTLTSSMINININWSFFIVFRKISDWFDYPQDRADFDTIEISSGSSLINLNTIIGAFILYIIIHVIFWFIRKCVRKSKKLLPKLVKKVYRSFTFGMYVILVFEGFISLCLCSFSELGRYKVNATGAERNSFYFSVFFTLICFATIFLILLLWVLIKPIQLNARWFLQKELYDGIKLKRWARLQPIMFLVRRAILCLMIIFGRSFHRTLFMSAYFLVNLAHCVLICCIRPFQNTSENITDIGNEIFMTTFCLFLVFHNSESDWNDTKVTIFYWMLVMNNVLDAMFSIGNLLLIFSHVHLLTLYLCVEAKADLRAEDYEDLTTENRRMELHVAKCLPKRDENTDLRCYKYRDKPVRREGQSSYVSNPSLLKLNRCS